MMDEAQQFNLIFEMAESEVDPEEIAFAKGVLTAFVQEFVKKIPEALPATSLSELAAGWLRGKDGKPMLIYSLIFSPDVPNPLLDEQHWLIVGATWDGERKVAKAQLIGQLRTGSFAFEQSLHTEVKGEDWRSGILALLHRVVEVAESSAKYSSGSSPQI